MDRNETELHSRWRHSDSRTAAACDGFPDHVWTWIQACKCFLESSWSLLSYASNLKSISCRSRPQSLFWRIGPCIMLSTIQTRPRVEQALNRSLGSTPNDLFLSCLSQHVKQDSKSHAMLPTLLCDHGI